MPQISNIVEQFGTYARTWVYVGNRELNQTESTWLVEQVISFTNTWQTHGKPMNATGFVFSNRNTNIKKLFTEKSGVTGFDGL